MNAIKPTSFDRKIAASKLSLLAEQNAVTFLASNIGVPLVVAALLYNIGDVAPEIVTSWLAAGILICIIRGLHHRGLRHFEQTNRALSTWEKELIFLSALSGSFWSFCGILFLDTENQTQSLVVLSAILGVLSGAVPALASHYKVFLAFVLSVWLPAGIYYLTLEDPLYLAVSILGTLFLMIVISFSRSQRRIVDQALRFRFENIELLEELQIQKQRAEDANRAKSRFLAVASHDLRQPIHAMRLFSDSLLIRLKEESNLSIMHMLKSSIETLSGLFDSLLDISKLDAEAIEPQIHRVDVSQMLRSLSTEFSVQCFDKGLRCSCRSTNRLCIDSDAVLLERVLRNLIWNAIKYTDQGGILVAARKRGSQLRIEVWDTGCGIPADEMPKIFTEFHQIDRPDAEAREGIGLGLSIVDRLCKLLGYKISLKSRPERGSVFFIEMPLAEAKDSAVIEYAEGIEETLPSDSDLKGVQVLVIDDEQDIRQAMKQLLEDWGCTPTVVENDQEAIAMLENFTPDIIVTDFHLKNSVNGDKIIQLVHEEVGYEVPSIIVTGDTSAENLTLADSPSNALMHKPLKPRTLKENIIRLLNEQTL